MQTSTTQHTASTFPELPLFDEDDTLTDDELLEFESRLSRDHDDAAYWQGGAR